MASIAALAACTSSESATNLRTSGPPMIEQVRLNESYLDSTMQYQQRRVFAFGTHPQAVVPDQVHHVDTAMAVQSMNGTGTGIRVIFGSLLVGNYLEEIQCRQVVDTDAFDKVPLGTTPDDIAKCSVPMDPGVLAKTCKGAHAVCLCHLDGGCGGIAKGLPVGVLDDNQDGAADVHRMIDGAIGIKCHDDANTRTINVPIDLDASYYNPSGFQDPPAIQGGGFNFDEMGPAIELFPAGADGTGKVYALPTNMTCGLTFSPDVVGKNNEQVCAPPNGRPAGNAPQGCDDVNIDQCNQSCKPGDVSAFTFKTEALQMLPAGGWYDGDTGVDPTMDLQMVSLDGVPLDPSQIGTLQVFEGASMTPYTQFTVVLDSTNASNSSIFIHWTSPTGLAPNTMYTIVVPKSFQDAYHVGLPMAQTFHFTTGA